ncbi:hypothetical protein Tco_0079045 [Tanacetum coccineum]
MLQIFGASINRALIDYAERMWEELHSESIPYFTERHKKNLAQHTQGKKKATLIVIPSVRFTKLIIFTCNASTSSIQGRCLPSQFATEEPIWDTQCSAKGNTKGKCLGCLFRMELISDGHLRREVYDAYLIESRPASRDILQTRVEGKGKEKVGAEQAARVLLNLQTPKKKSCSSQ